MGRSSKGPRELWESVEQERARSTCISQRAPPCPVMGHRGERVEGFEDLGVQRGEQGPGWRAGAKPGLCGHEGKRDEWSGWKADPAHCPLVASVPKQADPDAALTIRERNLMPTRITLPPAVCPGGGGR